MIIPKYLVYSENGELDAFCYKETDEDRNIFINFDLGNINIPQELIDRQELIINEIFEDNFDYIR